MQHFDVIVIGTGAVGSATLYQLADRGAKVLGIDRYDPPHDRGSSHGQTRMIRQAYFEHPDYVPLLLRAYQQWDALERLSERRLLEQVGLIEIGPPDGIVVPGVLKAAHAHGLPIEELSASELRGRFPGLRSPEGTIGVFEPTAGFLYVEQCIAAYLQLARQAGAQLRTNVSAECRVDGQGVRIEAGNETFAADRCVVTAGPWAGEVLADLGLALEVVRSPLFWYRCEDPSFSASAGMPCFFYELPHGYFYGFPAIDSAGVKVARHGGGAHVVNPLEVDRALDEREQAEIEEFLGQWLPGVSHECLDHRVCMYTMTSDEHFVVDRHPSHEQIVFAAGLSGHGFKFSCVLGEALSDLALSGNTQLPIDFLSLKRFNS